MMTKEVKRKAERLIDRAESEQSVARYYAVSRKIAQSKLKFLSSILYDDALTSEQLEEMLGHIRAIKTAQRYERKHILKFDRIMRRYERLMKVSGNEEGQQIIREYFEDKEWA